jgi:predicted RND superfamily exporter protein
MIATRWIWFTFALIVFAIAWPYSERLRLDRSLERMFPRNDADRLAFERLEEEFGVSHFLVFAYRDAELWNADGSGIERAAQIRKEIESIPGVIYALDLSRINEMLTNFRGPDALLGQLTGKTPIPPLLDPKNRLAREYRELFVGQTHAKESDLVAIGILLASDASRSTNIKPDVPGDRNAIDARTSADPLVALRAMTTRVPGGLLVGHLAMVDEGFREIEQDGTRLALYSTISLSLLMLMGFRSLRWTLIAVIVVQWSLVVTRAILVLVDWELTMVSSMLSSIVMVVGVATTMHWMLGYQHDYERTPSNDRGFLRARSALQSSCLRLWQPIVWACVTDAIGFGSLMLSRVGPVQDYGSMMAIACGVVLAGIFMILPALALCGTGHGSVSPGWDTYRLGHVPGEAYMAAWLQSILRWACRNRAIVLAVTLLLFIVAALGSMRLRVETDFLKNFQSTSPIATAYRAVESELGGAGIWDVMLPAPQLITEEYFKAVEALEKDLLSIEIPGAESLRLTSALSLADTDRVAREASVLRMVPIEARLIGMRQSMGSFFDTLLSGSGAGRQLRIMLRSRERSEAEQKDALIAAVQKTVRLHLQRPEWQWAVSQNDPTSLGNSPRVVISGYYVLLTRLVEHVVADQWLSFLVASLGIAIAMAIAIRSWKLALIALIPSALPNMVVLGVLGWSGTAVNLGAAMIAAVSMGLGVDSSLHYLFKYREERREGKSVMQALSAAQAETGLAVVMATLALVIGFSSMALSNFLPTVAFGTLAAWTMVGSLIGNLCLMPAMLYCLEKD